MEEATAQILSQVEQHAFEFPVGIYGFPELKRYVVSAIPGGGDIFKQMTAVDDPSVGFTLVFPFAFFAEYEPDVPDDAVREIGAEGPDQIILMAIANVPKQFKETTVNLKAPLIFNPYTRKARQVILADDRWSTRERLFKG